MKKILFLTIIFLFFGLINQSHAYTPECSNKIVVNTVIKLYKQQLEKFLNELNQYKEIIKQELGTLDPKTVKLALIEEGESLEDIENLMILWNLDKTKIKTAQIYLDAIRTTNINKSINKSSCAASIKIKELNFETTIKYTAQITDDKKQVWVELIGE